MISNLNPNHFFKLFINSKFFALVKNRGDKSLSAPKFPSDADVTKISLILFSKQNLITS